MSEELRRLRKLVKYREREVRTKEVKTKNERLLNLRSRNPKEYWNILKRVAGMQKQLKSLPNELIWNGLRIKGDRTLEVWEEAFRRLSSSSEEYKDINTEFWTEIKQEVETESKSRAREDNFASPIDDLNRDIEKQEIANAITDLKNNKAPGIDNIITEIIKYGGNDVEVALWKLCREIFQVEMIPKDWARGLIFPIFKEGDPRVPDNYRGITLLSVVGKLYSMILNQRVTAWCEAHRVLVEEQAGFRPGRSTLDHLFSLSEILRTRKNLGKKTHCCFLDIRKAYDRVFRVGLWKRMLDVGINGKIWRVIRQLYEVVESCVLVGNQQTGWFSVDVGSKTRLQYVTNSLRDIYRWTC